ncbi:hypothetical protein AADEFJLK_02944 [Methylovulum psychrotolerans]|uniref:Uncharacterized protein n=1 Tax=Methylovulum psychrotolerans TaxID=1704499 RepID=A0A2S5CL72_9GAMM|nr:hypothetical protein AADEFJLK_02944 [Methylovulum psychrotolerans]
MPNGGEAALAVVVLAGGGDTARVGVGGEFALGGVAVLEALALGGGDAGDTALAVALEGDAEPGAVDNTVFAVGQGVAERVLDFLQTHAFGEEVHSAVFGGQFEVFGVPFPLLKYTLSQFHKMDIKLIFQSMSVPNRIQYKYHCAKTRSH